MKEELESKKGDKTVPKPHECHVSKNLYKKRQKVEDTSRENPLNRDDKNEFNNNDEEFITKNEHKKVQYN